MSPADADQEEVSRALNLLQTLISAQGLTNRKVDARLERRPGYISQVLTGRLELKYRHILEILAALELDPGVFFRALYLSPEDMAGDRLTVDDFRARIEMLGYDPDRLAPRPPEPPLAPEDLDRRIRNAIQKALGAGGVVPQPNDETS